MKAEETKKKDDKTKKKDVLSVQSRINVRKAIRKEETGEASKEEAPLVQETQPEPEKKEEEEEPEFFELENPCRILYSQEN